MLLVRRLLCKLFLLFTWVRYDPDLQAFEARSLVHRRGTPLPCYRTDALETSFPSARDKGHND